MIWDYYLFNFKCNLLKEITYQHRFCSVKEKDKQLNFRKCKNKKSQTWNCLVTWHLNFCWRRVSSPASFNCENCSIATRSESVSRVSNKYQKQNKNTHTKNKKTLTKIAEKFLNSLCPIFFFFHLLLFENCNYYINCFCFVFKFFIKKK